MGDFRYLIELEQIPDEALWCEVEDYEKLLTKVRDFWQLSHPVFKYHLQSSVAEGSKHREVVIADATDFDLWLCRCVEKSAPTPLTRKLIATEHHRLLKCMNTADHAPAPRKPLLEKGVVERLGGGVILRNVANDSVVICGSEHKPSWGSIIVKARLTWSVHRPVFRYVDEDDSSGGRCVVSIGDSDDFSIWVRRRMSFNPELTVFESAPQQLVNELERETRVSRSAHPLFATPKSPFRSQLVPEASLQVSVSSGRGQATSLSATMVSGATASLSPFSRIKNSVSATELQRAVDEGHFGPSFSTPSDTVRRNRQRESEKHFERVVAMQRSLKM